MYALWIDSDQRFSFSESDNGGIEISDDAYIALISGHEKGAQIFKDKSGHPILLEPSLDDFQKSQKVILQSACQSAITAGFTSRALGTAYSYGSQLTDQNNLLSALNAAQGQAANWTTPLWCADGACVWDYRPHTADNVQQVNRDWVAFRTALQQKYAGLVEQVMSAKTVAAVQAVNWS